MSKGIASQFRSRRNATLECKLYKAQKCLGKPNDLIVKSSPDYEFLARNIGNINTQPIESGGVVHYKVVSRSIETSDEINVVPDDKIFVEGFIYNVVSVNFKPSIRTLQFMKEPYGITIINLRK